MNITDLEKSLEDKVHGLGEQVLPQLEDAKRRLQDLNSQAVGFIKEHPVACLLGGVALGYLVALLARRGR